MARGRKKGRPVHGWLVIDKPAGMTSTDAVALARRAFGAQKAGHAGTLDPLATGVLAIAFGEATKTVPWATDSEKTYRFTVRWGIATATDDTEGAPVATSTQRPTEAEIRAALPAFRGDILQVPPQFSAVRVEGERAYDLAREGEALDLAARPLHVARLDLLGQPDADHAAFEMVCGKGGYVRSIARDLGAALGCLGHVAWLRRTRAGPFGLDGAVDPARLRDEAGSPALDALLQPVEAGLGDLPELPCTAEGAARLRNGHPGQVLASSAQWGEPAWASHAGRPVAIGVYRAGALHPTRVFLLDGAAAPEDQSR